MTENSAPSRNRRWFIFAAIVVAAVAGVAAALLWRRRRRRAEQELQQAQVLHDDGKLEEAIGAYAKIWATQTGRISVSAPAMEDWLGILWQRNQPKNGIVMGDREAAVDGGARYIKLTGPLKDKMEEDDLAKWMRVEKLVKKYQTKLKEEQAEVP